MSEFEPSHTPEQPPAEAGIGLDALKFEQTKGEINLNIANRYYNPPEYEEYYSGVCDVNTPEVARAMADKLREDRKDPNRKIMIGVMATRYSLNHDDGDDCPDRKDIANAFTDDPDVLNTIHFADFYNFQDGRRPWKGGESPDVLENLELCVQYGGEHLQAIQLDLTWPKPEIIKEFKEKHPNISIILQVGKFALEEVEYDPQDVADKLLEYGDSIDYAMLDFSLGKGRAMTETDLTRLERIFNLIQYKLPELGLTIAGGFGRKVGPEDPPGTLDPIDALARIAKQFPNISIDAQGGLKAPDAPRSHGHVDATTPADLAKSIEYIGETSSKLDSEPVDSPHKPSYIAL